MREVPSDVGAVERSVAAPVRGSERAQMRCHAGGHTGGGAEACGVAAAQARR